MMENKNRPHVKDGPIKYTKGYRTRRVIMKLINAIIMLLIIAIVGAVIFVFIKQPVKTSDGYIMAEPIYEIVEHGEKIAVIKNDTFHLFTPLVRAITTQEVYFAEVVAGPYGEIERAKGGQRVSDGKSINRINIADSQKEFLDMEYIVRKISDSGDTIENEYDEIIVKENILGGISAKK